MDPQLINPTKLHEELALAGLPVESVTSTGRIDYSRDLSGAEKLQAEEVIRNHDPASSAQVTTDQIVMALWKKIMLNDSTDADNLLNLIS